FSPGVPTGFSSMGPIPTSHSHTHTHRLTDSHTHRLSDRWPSHNQREKKRFGEGKRKGRDERETVRESFWMPTCFCLCPLSYFLHLCRCLPPSLSLSLSLSLLLCLRAACEICTL